MEIITIYIFVLNEKEFKISIIGLGYVGLPLYLLCNRKGFDVSGFDIDNKKILKLKKIFQTT